MEIETAAAAAPIVINNKERERSWVSELPGKKRKTDEKQISEEDFGEWVDEETVRLAIEKLNEEYDDFGFIDDEKLRDEARAYHQRRIDNPFDIDKLPPPPIPDCFEEIWPVNPSSWRWERVKELMHYAVETEQGKKGWNLSDLNLVKANKLQCHYYITFEAKHDQEYSTYQTTVCDDIGYGSIDVEIFQRKGQQVMDTKSLAKSKRAHSQHHSKKHHPKPTPKTPSAGAATSSQNTNVKQVKEKVQHSRGSKQLPSNWDRYEHESDSDSNVPPQGSTSQPSDVIFPKSKGSDYAYLISEAQSRAQSSYDTGSLLSFDDVFTDFNQEVGSLLGVRGQSILSWAADDDFLSESKASGSQEASFLSMDLNALAEQLAKVDISERLYIEADLLPPELRTGELQTSHKQEPCKSEVPHKSETNIEVSSELSNIANQCDWEIEISGTTGFDHPVKTEVSGSTSIPNDSFIPESKSQFNAESDSVQNKSQSIFKATDAEAELDMLLDSFCEPNIPQSSVLKEDPRYSINEAQGDTSTTISVETSSAQLVSSPFKNGVDVSKSASTLDDSLDDLLKETSNQINQDVRSQSSNVKTVAPSVLPSSSSDTTQSKLLDDFDSWLDTI